MMSSVRSGATPCMSPIARCLATSAMRSAIITGIASSAMEASSTLPVQCSATTAKITAKR